MVGVESDPHPLGEGQRVELAACGEHVRHEAIVDPMAHEVREPDVTVGVQELGHDLPLRQREVEDHEHREPFRDPASRVPVWRFPRETPIGGEPPDVWQAVTTYSERLQASRLPKLMLYATPVGAVLLTMILGAVYMLRSFQVTMLGESNASTRTFPDLDHQEKWVLYPIVIMVILIGIYPAPLLRVSEGAVDELLTIISNYHATVGK